MPGTSSFYLQTDVASLGITDPSKAKVFAYYTPSNTTYSDANPDSFILDGPRTILTRLSTATAASGQILSMDPPARDSLYSIQFNGPYVSCNAGNSTVVSLTDFFLERKNIALQKDFLNETFAYYAFVPAFGTYHEFDSVLDNGTYLTAIDQPRLQEKPINATNELYVKFFRYLRDQYGSLILDALQQPIAQPQYVVCRLWNASYDLTFAFNNTQSVKQNSLALLNQVQYPSIHLTETSDLIQLSFSAFFWGLCDQLVGSIGLISSTKDDNSIPTYSSISTGIEHNSLLGSNDLDYFFDLNHRLQNISYGRLSPQRFLDKALAQNKTLPALIESLSFNTTVSLLSDPILT